MTSRGNYPRPAVAPALENTLRQRAEARLDALHTAHLETLSPQAIQQLLHELRVHQVELEMQNEELRRAQAALEESRTRYVTLYDRAPVGYASVSQVGVILEANLHAASLLGVPRSALGGQPLSHFIFPPDQDIHYRHTRQLFATREPQNYALRLQRQNGEVFWAYLETTVDLPDAQTDPVALVVLSDVTVRKQAEEDAALQAVLQLQKQTFDALAMHIALLDASGTIVLVNAAWRRFAEQEQGDVQQYGVGANYLQVCDAVTGEDAADAAAVARGIRAVTAGHSDSFVHEYCCPGAPTPRCFIVHVTRCVERDAVRVVVAHEDVTAFRQSEQARQESDTRFRHLIEGSLQGVLVQRHGRPLFANPAFIRMFGYQTLQEVLQVDSVLIFIAPQEHERIRQYEAQRWQGDMYVSRHYEHQARRADGTLFWVDVQTTLVTWDGLPAVQVTAYDITQRKRAEEALRQNEAQLRLVMDHMPARIAYVDRDRRYRFVNKSFETWHGLHREQIDGQLIADVIGADAYEQLLPFITTVLSGQEVTTELRVPSRRGEVCDIRMHYVPHKGEHGAINGFVALIEDITEHKRFQTNLLHAQKLQAIGTLAGGIAHDFNNMLGSIFGYAELALREIVPHSPVAQYMEDLLQVGERASNLVRQLLSFSRQNEEVRHAIALHDVIHDVLKLLRASLPTTVTIRQHLDAGVVVADPTQMHQVVMNLCVNAAQAMGDRPGVLDIRLQAVVVEAAFALAHPPLSPGPGMRLTVQDNGHGMQPEILAHIFEPFFTTKAVGQGTGLGLAVVHGIVSSHGGVITVTSVPDQGTTFSVYLPAVPQASAVALHAQAELIPTGQGRVLLVDDEVTLVHTGALLLEQLGYRVVSHTSSQQALAEFRAAPHDFDVVVTDQTMPDMTGDVLIAALRRLRPDIPIILCTGFSSPLLPERRQALGIAAVLYKPLRLRTLAQALQQSLAPSGPSDRPAAHWRVLLVDDDDSFRAFLRQALVQVGHEVVEARHGREGVVCYRQHGPDLVILDLIMPEQEGIETLDILQREFPNSKVIAISGGGRGSPQDYLTMAQSLGARRTLVKPFAVQELLDVIGQVMYEATPP